MMSHAVRRHLENIYHDIANETSYGSIENLLKAARKRDRRVTRADIREWLTGKDEYTLFVKRPKRFRRMKIYVKRPRTICSADLADFQRIAEYNDGFRYTLIMIDSFSRYLWVFPLKTKQGREVSEKMEEVIKQNPFKKIHVDSGREFWNDDVKLMLHRYKAELYSTHGISKAAIAERVIRTFKAKLFKHMNHLNTWKWIDIYRPIVKA
jgi:hypothetical protein